METEAPSRPCPPSRVSPLTFLFLRKGFYWNEKAVFPDHPGMEWTNKTVPVTLSNVNTITDTLSYNVRRAPWFLTRYMLWPWVSGAPGLVPQALPKDCCDRSTLDSGPPLTRSVSIQAVGWQPSQPSSGLLPAAPTPSSPHPLYQLFPLRWITQTLPSEM